MQFQVPPHARQRWYDQKPETSRAVTMLERYPARIQCLISTALSEFVGSTLNQHYQDKTLRSLGVERIKALYLSKSRRRAIDKNPEAYYVLEMLSRLTHDERLFLSEQMNHLTDTIRDYFQEKFAPPTGIQDEELPEMVELYLESGLPEVPAFLEQMSTALNERLFPERYKKEPAGPPPTLLDDGSGMRIDPRQFST